MSDALPVDVLIVGSGPAGMSTALHIAQLNPAWAGRMVVVDRAVHPRKKLCGGGVTQFGTAILTRLGLTFDAPHMVIDELRIRFGKLVFSLAEPAVMRIVRRDEFDHWLVREGQQRGIDVRQGEGVLSVVAEAGHIRVVTTKCTYAATVVVAADGALSTVKRQLNWSGVTHTARLLEVLTPDEPSSLLFRDRIAAFDFTPMMRGLQGYYWDFPSFVAGEPYMNRGIFDGRVRPDQARIALKATLAEQLRNRQHHLADYPLEGHPIPWLGADTELSRPHVLLVGDAAGAEPLFGEGIAFALAYGEAAAHEIADAFAQNTFEFTRYRQRVFSHWLLRQIPVRTRVARLLHTLPRYPRLARFLWTLTPVLFRSLALYRPAYIPMRRPRLIRCRSTLP